MNYFNIFSSKNQKSKRVSRTNKKTRKNMKKMNCSPAVKGKTLSSHTCYTVDVLMKIKEEYNKSHVDNKIDASRPNKIWEELNHRLVRCEKEDCWLKELKDETLRKNIDEYIFAPDSPPEWRQNPNEWLSNFDIMKVMKQYEDSYHNFEFIGPSPIDFDKKIVEYDNNCVENEICNLSLNKMLENHKTKIGIIFNLDKHDEPGSHWVSLFIDLEDIPIVFYFDSTGEDIPDEINVLKDRIIKQGKELKNPIHFKFYKNYKTIHQTGNSECGMYSLFFIITMLTGETEFDKKMSLKNKLDLFKKKRIPDKYVEKYRNIYFNN